jgi:hypothetical protein
LVKALVELHEGWITLESEPTEGASFKIHLPHQSSAGKGNDAPAGEAVKPGTATAAMESLESGSTGSDPIEDVA